LSLFSGSLLFILSQNRTRPQVRGHRCTLSLLGAHCPNHHFSHNGCEQIRKVREVQTLASGEKKPKTAPRTDGEIFPPLRPSKACIPPFPPRICGWRPSSQSHTQSRLHSSGSSIPRILPLSAAHAMSGRSGHWEHWEHWAESRCKRAIAGKSKGGHRLEMQAD